MFSIKFFIDLLWFQHDCSEYKTKQNLAIKMTLTTSHSTIVVKKPHYGFTGKVMGELHGGRAALFEFHIKACILQSITVIH